MLYRLRSVLASAATTLVVLGAPESSAHLMPAQTGTINIAGDGGFVVLSVPASAFAAVDDDGDGKLSVREMKTHHADIERQVLAGLQLRDTSGLRPLQGVMLNLSPPDDDPTGAALQLVVLGRFLLATPNEPMRLQISLFGKHVGERVYHVTASRGHASQLVVFTPERTQRPLFAEAWMVFIDYVVLGAEHVFAGFDHLLFLLVVLAAGWNWRHVLVALTCFTLGHCVTLAISVWGGVRIPPSVVEPAIAATIVGMALYDLQRRRRNQTVQSSVHIRMALVFGCALIHGLGLGSTLLEFGLDGAHRVISLAGFNVGIELGQVAVALIVGVLMLGVMKLRGARGVQVITLTGSYLGIGVGTTWFVQRVLESI